MLVKLLINSPHMRKTVEFSIPENSTIQDFVDIARNTVIKNFEYAQQYVKSELRATMNGLPILGDFTIDTQIRKLCMWNPNCYIHAVAEFFANEEQAISPAIPI